MTVSATEAVQPAQPPGLYQPTTKTDSKDKDMFLNLLVAQLRYQDPMNPADSGQFLAQSAQFTSLEKMQDVADQTAALLSTQVSFGAANMVGKNVTYLDADGTSVSGLVDSVTYDVTGPMFQIGGVSVSLGQVQSVGTAPAAPGNTTGDTTGNTADPATDTTGTGTATTP